MSIESLVQRIDTGQCMQCHRQAQKLRYPSIDGTLREAWVHVGDTITARNPHPVVSADYLIEELP